MQKKWLSIFIFCISCFMFIQASSCEPDPPHCQLEIISPVSSEINQSIKVEVTFKYFPLPSTRKNPASIVVQGSSGPGMSDQSECQISASPGEKGSCIIAFKTPGQKTIYASTSYETDCSPTTSVQHLVNQQEGPATTLVNVYSTAVGTGKSMKFEAQVSGSRLDKKPLQGTVTFTGGNSPCTASLDSNGKVSCIQGFTNEGKYTITATFTPSDSTLYLPASGSVSFDAYGQVLITGTIKPNPAYTTSHITVDVLVRNADGASSVVPAGKVQVSGGCIPDSMDEVLLVNGMASIPATCPDAGTKDVQVIYLNANDSYFLSSSKTIGQIKVVEYEEPVQPSGGEEPVQPSGGTGCLVDGQWCVSPCPNPSTYTQSCTP